VPSSADRFDRVLIAALAAMLLALGMASPWRPSAAQDAPSGDARNGKRLYLATGCFECHGRFGEGGAFNGPAPILAGTELPFESFTYQLREPLNDMPAYTEAVLPDRDVVDIFAYVKTLAGPKAPVDIPLLKD
jgi:mono/diheme cytochrome c family protein